MNIKSFFTSQYLFQVNNAFISPGEYLFFVTGAVLVLLAVVLKIAAVLAPNPVDKKYRNKFYRLFLTIGIFELVWYFFRYENATYLDTRFVAWLIVLIGIFWLISLISNTIKNYKAEKTIWEKEQVRQKYLPV